MMCLIQLKLKTCITFIVKHIIFFKQLRNFITFYTLNLLFKTNVKKAYIIILFFLFFKNWFVGYILGFHTKSYINLKNIIDPLGPYQPKVNMKYRIKSLHK